MQSSIRFKAVGQATPPVAKLFRFSAECTWCRTPIPSRPCGCGLQSRSLPSIQHISVDSAESGLTEHQQRCTPSRQISAGHNLFRLLLDVWIDRQAQFTFYCHIGNFVTVRCSVLRPLHFLLWRPAGHSCMPSFRLENSNSPVGYASIDRAMRAKLSGAPRGRQ